MNINVINVAPNDKVMQNAEQGCISVATKENGSLAYIGIPATNLYEFGVSKSLALKLLEYKLSRRKTEQKSQRGIRPPPAHSRHITVFLANLTKKTTLPVT